MDLRNAITQLVEEIEERADRFVVLVYRAEVELGFRRPVLDALASHWNRVEQDVLSACKGTSEGLRLLRDLVEVDTETLHRMTGGRLRA